MDFFPLRGGETRSVQPKTKSKRQTEAGRPKVPEWVDRLTYERFARTEDEPVWPRRRERLRKAGQGENEERARATRERVEKEFISSGHIDAVERAICATNTIVSFRAAGYGGSKGIYGCDCNETGGRTSCQAIAVFISREYKA